MKITVIINDYESDNPKLLIEHGLSLFIEADKKILLDKSKSDAFLKNAEVLNIDLNEVDYFVISHGHYDHAENMQLLPKNMKIVAHPKIFTKRYEKSDETFYAGLNDDKQSLEKEYDVRYSAKPYKLSESAYFIGEAERIFEFENCEYPTVLESGEIDLVEDDSGLVFKTDKGLVIVAGCAHTGICNIIEYCKKIMNENTVYAVVGGFHLRKDGDKFRKTIDYLKSQNIKRIVTGHCTCLDCFNILKRELDGVSVDLLETGKTYEF